MSQGKKAEFQVFQQGFSFQFENCVIVWRLRHVPLILERYETALTEFPHLFSAALPHYPAAQLIPGSFYTRFRKSCSRPAMTIPGPNHQELECFLSSYTTFMSVHSVHVPHLFELRVFSYFDAYRVFFFLVRSQVPI